MKIDRKKQKCVRCKIIFAAPHVQRHCSWNCANKNPWNKGKKLPQYSGENSGVWLGIDAPYHAIHQWMIRTYGKAKMCESEKCNGLVNSYEWSLLKGKTYQRKRENFWQLCKSCHRKYDFTDREYKFARTRERDKNGRFVCLSA